MKEEDRALLPMGYAASEADWNEAFAGRPMDMSDWNSLTLGEQHRYAAQECKTKGAVYTSHIREDRIEFSVSLPPALRLSGITREEAQSYERELHRVVEDRIAWILQYRALVASCKAESSHDRN